MEPTNTILYAASLRLDKPLALGERLEISAALARDAAYEAARRLFDCALSRQVSFLLVRGELFGEQYSPRAPLFLIEQTNRLAGAGIPCCFFNEGPALDARWLTQFPPNTRWLASDVSEEEFPMARLLESKPPTPQGLSPAESGPMGAWLASLPQTGGNRTDSPEPDWEFIELCSIRWEPCELDATGIGTEDDLSAAWRAVKEGFRERAGRPVLLSVKLTGIMNWRGAFYGGEFRDTEALARKLNAGEEERGNFVIANSIEDGTELPERTDAQGTELLDELAFFESSLDPLVDLLDAMKERGLFKRVLADRAAPLLENMTSADVRAVLKEARTMASDGIFGGGTAPE